LQPNFKDGFFLTTSENLPQNFEIRISSSEYNRALENLYENTVGVPLELRNTEHEV